MLKSLHNCFCNNSSKDYNLRNITEFKSSLYEGTAFVVAGCNGRSSSSVDVLGFFIVAMLTQRRPSTSEARTHATSSRR